MAAFNGGFRLDMAQGGYQSECRTVRPLVEGRATFGVRADGTVDLGMWGRDLQPATPYASAFQSLDLIVDGGQDVSGISRDDHLRWGETLGGRVFVWRSGVGIDARGNLVYAAGMLDIVSLADVLRAAGAVRAMELDINSYWVSFDTFVPGANGPAAVQTLTEHGTQREPLPRTRHPILRRHVRPLTRTIKDAHTAPKRLYGRESLDDRVGDAFVSRGVG